MASQIVGDHADSRQLRRRDLLHPGEMAPHATQPQAAFVVHGSPLFDADRTDTADLESGKGSMSTATRPDLDAVIARAEIDPAKRDALYAQIVQAQDYPYVYLLQAEYLYDASARLQWPPRVDGKPIVKEMRVKE